MSLSPEILDLLKNVPLFSGLPKELLAQHLGNAKRLTFAAGKILLSPGDASENIYVILSGRLRLNPQNPNDEPVAMFGEGESVGEMTILNGNKSLDYLIADTHCELLYIDLATIWSLLESSHHASLNMLNILSIRTSLSKRSNQNIESQHGYVGLNQVDELTGLYNKHWMFKAFARQIHRCAKNHEQSTMMMVSIDEFERYNQCNGRLGGDQALRTIAQTILSCLRPNDMAAHYDGKVFAVFMPHTTLEEGRKAGQRLLLQSSEAEIVTPNGDALPHVTISIGLAEIHAGNTLQQLIDQTTGALQRAKQAGRNCVSD